MNERIVLVNSKKLQSPLKMTALTTSIRLLMFIQLFF